MGDAEHDNQAMAALFQELRRDSHDDLKSVIALTDGSVVLEEYLNGAEPNTLHDARSVGKSITSLLAGIALDRGWIGSMDESLGKYLLAPPSTSSAADITLRDLLTMRSGLDADDSDPASPGNEDRMSNSSDWLDFALRLPLCSPPGQNYVYASVNAFLVGAVVERASGIALEDLAASYLFGPLGITDHSWPRGPMGEGRGQGGLMLRLRDMAKIGETILLRGMGPETQVVSENWVEASLAPLVSIASVDGNADYYGYMWYRKNYRVGNTSITVHFASGNGGNKIYVVPARDMVVAIASTAYGRAYGHPRSEHILLRILGESVST